MTRRRTALVGVGLAGLRLLLGLGGVLRALVATAPDRDGVWTPAWSGPVSELVTGVDTGIHLPAKGERWIRLTLQVPAKVGNVIESDTFRFGLRVVLQGDASGV